MYIYYIATRAVPLKQKENEHYKRIKKQNLFVPHHDYSSEIVLIAWLFYFLPLFSKNIGNKAVVRLR